MNREIVKRILGGNKRAIVPRIRVEIPVIHSTQVRKLHDFKRNLFGGSIDKVKCSEGSERTIRKFLTDHLKERK